MELAHERNKARRLPVEHDFHLMRRSASFGFSNGCAAVTISSCRSAAACNKSIEQAGIDQWLIALNIDDVSKIFRMLGGHLGDAIRSALMFRRR